MTDKVEREDDAAETQVDDGARRSVPSDTLEYSVLKGRYRITDFIARGGMASVYRARDELLQRDVAVKLFPAIDGEATADRQSNELRILASLNHPNLVALFDAGVERFVDPAQCRMYLVMELLTGDTLRAKLRAGRISSREAAEIGSDLAEALEYVHEQGVVHHDVKPSNILMVVYPGSDRTSRAKLSDFGVASTRASAQEAWETSTGGTAPYLSPEQIRGDMVGAASDIYSLGLVLIECFSGHLEFPGQSFSAALARLGREPEIPSHVPTVWRHLLSSMTAGNPADRPLIHDIVLTLREEARSDAPRHRLLESSIMAPNETDRLAEVRRYRILDTPPDGAFDRITALAAHAFSVPIAIVSIVDYDRIWFKSHPGLDIDEIGRDAGLCASAILHDKPWVVEDARIDPRALANPLVVGELGVQFYAGVPLHTASGHNLGTLCVLDYVPRAATPAQMATLNDLAALVIGELELRLESRHLSTETDQGQRRTIS
ncbi:MAG: GAF domain-containing serine/threonine-protein kinase [Cryobacterium sp.]